MCQDTKENLPVTRLYHINNKNLKHRHKRYDTLETPVHITLMEAVFSLSCHWSVSQSKNKHENGCNTQLQNTH